MSYTREELDWLEAEWAFHLHGRTAFLSREDFLQLESWAQVGVSAEAVVAAMGAFFERRAKRTRPRAFVALAHLQRDVDKAVKLRQALARAGEAQVPVEGWEQVSASLRRDPRARTAFERWQRQVQSVPAPDHPGYLEAFDAERGALQALLALGAEALGPEAEALRSDLAARLREAGIEEGSLVWRRAWDHHWTQALAGALGLKV